MKKQLFFAFCLLSLFSCTHDREFDFEINVEHWNGQAPINRLIVTKPSGEVVKVFENPSETHKLKEIIPYVASDPENATLDFHWIFGSELGDQVSVFSSLGVHNGAYILIRALSSSEGSREKRNVVLFVDGIPAHYSGWDLEIPGLSSWGINVPNNGNLGLSVELDVNQSLYLRAKKFNSPVWGEYFVPNNLLQDTLYASLLDFKLPNPFITIALDELNSTDLGKLEMAELSPDLQYFTVLNTTGYNIPPTNHHPGYILPQGHFLPAAFRLHTYSYAQQRYWSLDKIFQFGEEIQIQKPDLVIKDKESKPGKEISMFVSGQPDIVSASCSVENGIQQLYWNIEGSPERFLPYKLPDINAYLPQWVEASSLFADLHVGAIRFDNLSMEQYRSGLPDRSKDVFARAKSGMLTVYE